MSKGIILEIKAMLERHWSAKEIAHKLWLDTDTVNLVIKTLKNS
jgi:hypothetical protein